MKGFGVATAAVVLAAVVKAQPFQPGQGLGPLGNLRTSDYDGPYNVSLLSQQAIEVEIGAAARDYKGGISDKDIVNFLTNVECLEGQFDTWGVFGQGFIGDLALGGPEPKGARQADLSDEVRMHLAEVALNEQGHALMTRHAGGDQPCPPIDLDKGFNALLGAAMKLPAGKTVEDEYGEPFDPFKNDQNFILSVLTLEELGATGNKGLAGLISNPVIANAVAGLATSATAQATIERMLLWQRRHKIIDPFNQTAQEVFARISAYRDSMDGEAIIDQGLINTDPRFIAVPFEGVNMIPTDIRGLTFNRSPQMNINILTLGSEDGVGGFFPEGLLGKIKTPEGFDKVGNGLASWPKIAKVGVEQSKKATGDISGPITNDFEPKSVPGMEQLTQLEEGTRIGNGPEGRGLEDADEEGKYQEEGEPVDVAMQSESLMFKYGRCLFPAESEVRSLRI